MRSFLAALRTLHLPYGKKSGSRITLDGVDGHITLYNDDGSELLVIDKSGLRAIGANFPDTKIEIDPHNVELNFYETGSTEPVTFSAFQHTDGTGLNVQTAQNANGDFSVIQMVPGTVKAQVLRRVDLNTETLESLELSAAGTTLNDAPIPRMASGTETMTPTTAINPPWGTSGDAYRDVVSVTFPTDRFTSAPSVVAMADTGAPIHHSYVSANNVTATGFDLVLDATGTGTRNVYWVATESGI